MHRGIVHDPGESPGWIYFFPKFDTSGKKTEHGAWVRFDNRGSNLEKGTTVEVKPKVPNNVDPSQLFLPEKIGKSNYKLNRLDPKMSVRDQWLKLSQKEQDAYTTAVMNEISRGFS